MSRNNVSKKKKTHSQACVTPSTHMHLAPHAAQPIQNLSKYLPMPPCHIPWPSTRVRTHSHSGVGISSSLVALGALTFLCHEPINSISVLRLCRPRYWKKRDRIMWARAWTELSVRVHGQIPLLPTWEGEEDNGGVECAEA